MTPVWRFFALIDGAPFEIETITNVNDSKQIEDAYKTLLDAYHDGAISAQDRRVISRSIYELTGVNARSLLSPSRLIGNA